MYSCLFVYGDGVNLILSFFSSMLLSTCAFILWLSGSWVISITGNEITQEPDNPNKKAKVDSSIDETKPNLKLTPSPYTNKQDQVGVTNDKTRESDDYPSDTDGCARNIDDEHKKRRIWQLHWPSI